jgi:ketosteroid isomerase-like protein
VVTVEDARIIQLRGFIDTSLLAQAFDTPGASIPSEIG